MPRNRDRNSLALLDAVLCSMIVSATQQHRGEWAMERIWRLILLIATLWALAGCGPPESLSTSSPSGLDLGGTWTTVSVPGTVITERFEAPQVQFTDGGRVQGATGCTDFSAPIRFEGERVAVGRFETGSSESGSVSTCSPRDREIEAAFVQALSQADHISGDRASGRLTISGPGGEIVLAQPAAQP